MPLYRICWIDQTGPDPTRKSTRPITPGLAYDVLDRLLADGIRAWAVRQRPDGRWTRIGAPTPARGRRVLRADQAVRCGQTETRQLSA